MDHHQPMAGIHISRFDAMRAEYMARFLVWVSVKMGSPKTAWDTTFSGLSNQDIMPKWSPRRSDKF